MINPTEFPEITYQITVKCPSGELANVECPIDWEGVCKEAADLFCHGFKFRILSIEHDERGFPISVSDATALMVAEYDLNVDGHALCEDCGKDWCICDEAHDMRLEAAE